MRAAFASRATWPPSAAVRQRSIADIAFNWPRLTWPALARRQAAPCARKMSATSSNGRVMPPAYRPDGLPFFPGRRFVLGGLLSGLVIVAMRPVATRV
jgi:hypothetical protein